MNTKWGNNMVEPSRTSIDRREVEEDGEYRVHRYWHPNGTLVEEGRYRINHEQSLALHGETRRWNSDGKFIGSYKLINGTGTQLVWYDNGQLFCENPLVNGTLNGLQRCWDESGYLLYEKFWYRNQIISKKRYRELQETDSTIPKYDDADFQSITQKRKRS